MSDTKYYMLLTGGKNNAGDFLIKHRAKILIETLRPDRRVVDVNAWEPFDQDRLRLANGAAAVILTGGPALQVNMFPDIYPMVSDLNNMTVPLVTLGIGWKSLSGRWRDTNKYYLTDATLGLLRRIESSGLTSSVRDYHTRQVLLHKGFKSFTVTGCPALFDLHHVGGPAATLDAGGPRRIGFSLGAGFTQSNRLDRQMKEAVQACRQMFPHAELVAVFHHAVTRPKPDFCYGRAEFWRAHEGLLRWLIDNGIAHQDISGSEQRLMDFYSSCDLHVGYRVHAHIFMNSISRPSILIAEDGRGKALAQVIGGAVANAFWSAPEAFHQRVLRRFGIIDGYDINHDLAMELKLLMGNEAALNQHFAFSRKAVDFHFDVMSSFIAKLP